MAPRTGKQSRPFVFNAPAAILKSLKANGVDVVGIANNHAFDQGRKGMLETLQHLEEIGLPYVGGGVTPHHAGPYVFRHAGFKIAFLAYTTSFNSNDAANNCKEPCEKIAVFDLATALSDIATAREKTDAVLVSLHWGTEYDTEPSDTQVDIAHQLAEAGATIIIGHHPHVLQPLELYQTTQGRTTVIAYSLGNFVSNQSAKYVHGNAPAAGGSARDGALLRVEIVERDYGKGITRIELGRVDYVPLWTRNNYSTLRTRKQKKHEIDIDVVAVDRMLMKTRAALAGFEEEVPEALKAEYIELKKAEALYLERQRLIGAALGREFMRSLPRPKANKAAGSPGSVGAHAPGQADKIVDNSE